MTKAKLLALFLAGAAFGAVAPRVLTAGTTTQPAVTLSWQTAQLFDTRARGPDGGSIVSWRACGYLTELRRDGGTRRVGEPCWTGFFHQGEAAAIARAMLASYDASW